MLRDLLKPAYRRINGYMGRIRRSQSARIPVIELREKHIANLRVVTDRQAFLERMPKNGVVAELGVDKGDFSEMILRTTRPAKLHLVDIWSSERYHSGLGDGVRQRFAKELQQDTLRIDLGSSTDVLPTYPEAYFDWIYIDTDHGYDVTAKELALARTKIKPGGIIAGHDYATSNWDGGVRYGVVEAVHEFCVQHDWELVLLTHETDRFLSFAIRAIKA